MAKIYGLFGAMTGKLADTVMSVRNGEQIARKYQPVVFNPSTEAQIAVRARMKALSQLSAIMAPVIAMRREGNVSSRNLFTKWNFPLSTFSANAATIDLINVQLTHSAVGLPNVNAALNAQGELAVAIAANVSANVDSVVYCVFARQADDKLRFRDSAVVTTPGTGGNFDHDFTGLTTSNDDHIIVLAYGIRNNTETAKTIFQNLTVATASSIATLLTSRQLTESDVTLTETRGVAVDRAS